MTDWANWCGSREPSPGLVLQIASLHLEATATTPVIPVCANPTGQSGLTIIHS